MKKLLVIALSALCVFSVTGCTQQKYEEVPEEKKADVLKKMNETVETSIEDVNAVTLSATVATSYTSQNITVSSKLKAEASVKIDDENYIQAYVSLSEGKNLIKMNIIKEKEAYVCYCDLSYVSYTSEGKESVSSLKGKQTIPFTDEKSNEFVIDKSEYTSAIDFTELLEEENVKLSMTDSGLYEISEELSEIDEGMSGNVKVDLNKNCLPVSASAKISAPLSGTGSAPLVIEASAEAKYGKFKTSYSGTYNEFTEEELNSLSASALLVLKSMTSAYSTLFSGFISGFDLDF